MSLAENEELIFIVMDLLAGCYDSSSSEDEDAASRPPPPAQAHDSHDEPHVEPARQIDEVAARAVLIQRFAARAQATTHRSTEDERRFTYKPYTRKRPLDLAHSRGKIVVVSAATHPKEPLFSTLRALPTASTTNPNRVTSLVVLPQWQEHCRMEGHTHAVNCLHWNPRYSPLLLSASMDHTIRVWTLPHRYYEDDNSSTTNESPRCRRLLNHHSHGIKSAKWSIDGQHIWSGGYDGLAAYVDVERVVLMQRYAHTTNEHVTSVLPHPTDPQLALFGTDRGRILQRDLRMDTTSPPAAIFGTKTTGEIHDLLFLPNVTSGDLQFLSSSALTSRDTSHQTLVVWDLRSTALMATPLNHDLCAFTSLYLHPNHRHVAAQSTTSEIMLFAAQAPYQRLHPKRSFHGGHNVQGFSIGCSFNASGSLMASGDIHGRVVLYNGENRRLLKRYRIYEPTTPCITVAFHPQWPSTLVTGGYDGKIELLDRL